LLSAGSCTIISDTALLEVAMAFPVATLGLTYSCPSTEVTEPLFVGDFYDVIAFTFNISFDTAYLTFLDLLDVNPDLLLGSLTTSPMTDPAGVIIHWESGIPVSIQSGKLFDLDFNYISLDHTLVFEAGSEVLNSSSNPVDITLNDGHIDQRAIPLVTAQPENDTVIENDDALFSVEASGVEEYIWQLSTDGGNSWTYLSDVIPYYNTHTPSLTISPVAYSMNGYQYSCRLDNEYCMLFSDAATLVVDTLTFISTPGSHGNLLIHPVPFKDNLHISLPGDFGCTLVSIYDARGLMLYSLTVSQNPGQSMDLDLDLSALVEGLYFMMLNGICDGRATVEMRKILKTD
jgi:hypothetical protein